LRATWAFAYCAISGHRASYPFQRDESLLWPFDYLIDGFREEFKERLCSRPKEKTEAMDVPAE